MNITSCPQCGGRVRSVSIGWKCESCQGFIDMRGEFHPHKEEPFMPPMTNGDKIRGVMAQGRSAHITREQVEKMRGKWIDARYSSKDVPQCQCSICGKKYIGLETDFCQYCGAPMTDKAVDILWNRLEAMQDEAETV